MSLLKKGLSGSLGKNLIDIVFSTQQVVDSEEHRLLTTLRDSQLKDNEARQTFYRKVIDSLDMGTAVTCCSWSVTATMLPIGVRMIPCKRMPQMRCSPISSVWCAPSRRAR